MAQFTLFSILIAAAFMSAFVTSQPPLNSAEQESVYRVLESINSEIPWRSLFPDDLCSSAPHGVVCDYFSDDSSSSDAAAATPHVTELSFGYVSDYSPNPPCDSNSTFNPSLLSPLSHLKKLFFYKCFTVTEIPFPDFSPLLKNHTSSLEELVIIDNPALVGSLDGKFSNLGSLRRLVMTGNGVSGAISNGFSGLVNLEQLTLSGNKFNGEIPMNVFETVKKLKILDLSDNELSGKIPESVGILTELIKVDLSYNGFSGEIPEIFKGLRNLEFLDLSYNSFGNYGVPLFLAEMHSLKEVYLSGNYLGGQIPEIWENLGGIMGIGLSGVGLIGNIPKSMGVHLRKVCYLGLDNNSLEGIVPQEFGDLENVNELNLENNNLRGRVPFSAGFVSRIGGKLKVRGNLDLCVDGGLKSAKFSGSLVDLKVCRETEIPQSALFHENSCPRMSLLVWHVWIFGIWFVSLLGFW